METQTPNLETYLKKISIFTDLSDDDRKHVIPFCKLHQFDVNDIIVKQGTHGNCFYIICEGFVNVAKVRGENEIFITTLGPHEHFGESALFRDSARIATIKAQSAGTCVQINSKDFKHFIHNQPGPASKVLYRMFQQLFERLDTTNRELEIRRSGDVGQDAIDKLFA
ncbi:cyclic nucleotide-binding domain-containing protein [Bacteriovoracaceae bacterium]|nr:cyclic nucleotide-binding domain-containing protein [Bacteriovoracaceae bacterium]